MLSGTARRIPFALDADHHELDAELARLSEDEGPIGEAVREVHALLAPHIAREEAFALPPLGLLPALASGEPVPDASWALAMSERLQRELPAMLDEHIAIVGALKRLMEEAQEMDRPAVAALAERMIRHAEFEEAVLYPATVLIGKYLALRPSEERRG